jgi:hypothetical protein
MCFQRLGMSWKNIRSNKKSIGAYRMDSLRDFLIKLDGHYKIWIMWEEDRENCPFVFVFMNEIYIHKTHANAERYLRKNATIN